MPTITKDSAGWVATHTIDAAGDKTITFKTENTFLDADVRAVITTPSGAITSGGATISNVGFRYNGSEHNFNVYGTADVSAPTITTPGFVSTTSGSKTSLTDGATVNASVDTIAVSVLVTTQTSFTPNILLENQSNIPCTIETTKPSGYFFMLTTDSNSAPLSCNATVVNAGYGTADHNNIEISSSGSSITIQPAAHKYLSVSTASFANAATSGITYTDISDDVPALVSNDYLYINRGYVPYSKISLAKLIPDAQDNAPASYIVSGYTAFDNDGQLLVGTMQIYDGTYTIT